MPFNADNFKAEKFENRTAVVLVPDLKEYFGKDEKPEWKVKGLTGKELGKANDAADTSRKLKAAAEGLVGTTSRSIVNSIKNLFDPNVTPDIAKRLCIFRLGSIDYGDDQELAVKICDRYPVPFFEITNKILELTGQGQRPGKLRPSGKSKKPK